MAGATEALLLLLLLLSLSLFFFLNTIGSS